MTERKPPVKMSRVLFTLTQHSAFGYLGRKAYEHAVEARHVASEQFEMVANEGGVLYETFAGAQHAETLENYPDDQLTLEPHASGTFSETVTIDGLKLYLPPKKRRKVA